MATEKFFSSQPFPTDFVTRITQATAPQDNQGQDETAQTPAVDAGQGAEAPSESAEKQECLPDIRLPPEAYVIVCGDSIPRALAQAGHPVPPDPASDAEAWNALMRDSAALEKLFQAFSENPLAFSAEARYLKHSLHSLPPEDNYLCFLSYAADRVPGSRLSCYLLRRYYEKQKYPVFPEDLIHPYFGARLPEQGPNKTPFSPDALAFLDKLVYMGYTCKNTVRSGIFCSFNQDPLTHVLCAVASYITETVYTHVDVATGKSFLFPYNFYEPKGDELELLNKKALHELYPDSHPNVHKRGYVDRSWDRLNMYQLIKTARDPVTREVQTRLTHRGWFYVG